MNVDDVKKALGEFVDDFTVEVEGNYIVIRAKHYFTSKDEYAGIVKRLESVNAERVSLGKQSHWRVPVSHAVEGSAQNICDKLDRTIDVLQVCLRDLAELKKALKQ